MQIDPKLHYAFLISSWAVQSFFLTNRFIMAKTILMGFRSGEFAVDRTLIAFILVFK